MSVFLEYTNEMHREMALAAIAASTSLDEAKVYLEGEHQLLSTPKKLEWIRDHYREQYEDLRHAIVPLKEKSLTHDLLNNALYAGDVMAAAMEQLSQRITEERIPAQYLSRVIRDLADVQAKGVEKKALLEGKPTVISETRDAAATIRALEAKGVIVKEIGPGDERDTAGT